MTIDEILNAIATLNDYELGQIYAAVAYEQKARQTDDTVA